MDEIDLAGELMEMNADLKRRARERREPPKLSDTCRDCDGPLEGPVLRVSGFCERCCRDCFQRAERLGEINGQGGGR